MRFKFGLTLLFALFLFSINAYAQDSESPAETADRLKLELIDVQAREEALRGHVQELDESLKPENIERSLAGVGSTRPEELRETRRRQLTIEKDGVMAQLKILETSRNRLESALREAEGRAYQESERATPETTQALVAQSPRSRRWLIF